MRSTSIWDASRAAADGDALLDAGIVELWIDPAGAVHPRRGAARALGLQAPLAPRAAARRLDPEQRAPLFALFRRAIAEGGGEGRLSLADAAGDPRKFRVALRRIDAGGAFAGLNVALVDLTREYDEIDQLRRSEENLRYIVEYNPQLPWIADAHGNIIDFTDRWLECSGLDRTQASGAGWLDNTHPDDIAEVSRRIERSHLTGEPFDVRVRLSVNGEYRWMRAQAYPRRDENGQIVRWYGYTEDIHESVLIEERIRWNAEHDPLTGLPNRALFSSELNRELERVKGLTVKFGVLLIDIDNFKTVNDLMGHQAGDRLLQHFAAGLRAAFDGEAMVARLGGDEFGILIKDLRHKDELPARALGALDIRECFSATGRLLECRASIGAATFPDDGLTTTELLRHADLALYHAKAQGKGQLRLFERSLLDALQQRVAMVNRARTAVREGTILTYYQPKVRLSDGALAGFEALLRWRDSCGNIRMPGEIYAAFEDHDVADLIGQTITRQVFSDMRAWKSRGLDFGHVSINVSSSELRRENFVERLLENMARFSIGVEEIEIEITEGVFLGSGSLSTREAIDALNRHAIPLALDDFGTGYASLSHLKSLPVSTLKIDRSFVLGMATLEGDHAIVSALISLGEALNMKVVAEGIEHVEQADELRKLGCGYAQGFLFSRPVSSEHVQDLMRSWGGARPPMSLP